jgi:aspartyl-tRNA(Asn)/glutamyl-tRNA(Gln) amidotransferase subunit A
MGRYILAEDYVRAVRGRDVLIKEVEDAMAECDGLLLPSVPIPAHKIGVSSVRIGGADELIRNVTLRLTQLFNVTGHPAITVPCGRTPEGLPIGAQLVGHLSGTSDLLHLAGATESYLGPGMSR